MRAFKNSFTVQAKTIHKERACFKQRMAVV